MAAVQLVFEVSVCLEADSKHIRLELRTVFVDLTESYLRVAFSAVGSGLERKLCRAGIADHIIWCLQLPGRLRVKVQSVHLR